MPTPTLVVTYPLDPHARAVAAEALGGAAAIVHLPDLPAAERAGALRAATVLLARNTAKDLRDDELPLIAGARLLQFVTAGIDFIPLGRLPPSLPVAWNGGGYAEPMAEHALAMALAAAKRLLVEHANLAKGEFNQFAPNRTLRGAVCGILGFGGIGVATARLMRAIGMRVHAINRRGASDEPLDWIGTPDRLDALLAAADVLVISLPLTRRTERLIGRPELARMKPDAILVNLARGEIVDEDALWDHLVAHPAFTACIDAWWIEPIRHGRFAMDHPFPTLPNVIGSPHNSAAVPALRDDALRRAIGNCRRALAGEAVPYLAGPDERMR